VTVWARVRDLQTGHQYDVPVGRLRILIGRGAVEEIPGRRHEGPADPAKPRRPLGVGPVSRRRRSS